MIVITGGAGFIGSCLAWSLNQQDRRDLVIVDNLGCDDHKWQNLLKRHFRAIVNINDFSSWLETNGRLVEAIFHLGACSSTTEADMDFLLKNNTQFSIDIARFCADHQIPLIYASSAATYGAGQDGYNDDERLLENLKPLNKYGYSKHLFDRWIVEQKEKPPFWAGLKFFNVYGPNEYHKQAQASVVYHAFEQITDNGKLRLFKSYRDEFADGEQKRDFVYVKDVIKIMLHLWQEQKHVECGVYNVGTGKARSFIDLGAAVFSALDIDPPRYEWIDMPSAIKDQYQYFTQATLENLRSKTGYKESFYSLEDGISDYVRSYLNQADQYL